MYVVIYHVYSDVPGKPDIPTVCDISDTSVELSWKAPHTDGGTPITSYTVEYMKRGESKWVPLITETPGLTFEVGSLQNSANYLFRVAASNKVCVGNSGFLQHSL